MEVIRRLVREGQFEFACSGNGLIQHDEALASWDAIIASNEIGSQWLAKNFFFGDDSSGDMLSESGKPIHQQQTPKKRRRNIAWRVDSFGHSDATPTILAELGVDALFVNRIHFRVKQQFRNANHMEFIWRGSPRGGSSLFSNPVASTSKDMFVHVLSQHYSVLEGYDFESQGVRPVTVPRGRATRLVQFIHDLAKEYKTHHVLVPFGDDLRFQQAEKQFTNMESLISFINEKEDGIFIKFSTLSEYLDAVHETAIVTKLSFPLLDGNDFFPYADDAESYWTGYYSSRSVVKRLTRELEGYTRSSSRFFTFARARATTTGLAPYASRIDGGRIVAASDDDKENPWATLDMLHFAKVQGVLASDHHGITGSQRNRVSEELLSKLRDGIAMSKKMIVAALEQLLTKRTISHERGGSSPIALRPALTFEPFDVPDFTRLPPGESQSSIQHPIIFYNSLGTARIEVARVKLQSSTTDSLDWNSVRNVQVTDWKGNFVTSQLYQSLAPRAATVETHAENDDLRVLHEDDSVDLDTKSSSGGKAWETQIYLAFKVEVPPMGFVTYFVSFPSQRDRVKLGKATGTSVSVMELYDLLDGEIIPKLKNQRRGNEDVSGRGSMKGLREQNLGEEEEGVMVMNELPSEEECEKAFGLENSQLALEFDCSNGLLRAISIKSSAPPPGEDTNSKGSNRFRSGSDNKKKSVGNIIKKRYTLRQSYHSFSSSSASSFSRQADETGARSSGKSGVHVFHPDRQPEHIPFGKLGRTVIGVVRGPLVHELQVLSEGLSHVYRLHLVESGTNKDDDNDEDDEEFRYALKNLEGQVHIQLAALAQINTDLVVRYESNFVSDGTLHTDNALGYLVSRKVHGDSPVSSNYFPVQSCVGLASTSSSSVSLDDDGDNDAGSADDTLQGILFLLDHPAGVTTSTKGIASVEIMLHRHHLQDDGKGLGEGLHDDHTGVLDMALAVTAENPFDLFERRRVDLVERHRNPLRAVFAKEKTELSALYNREAWQSRFEVQQSFLLTKSLPEGVQILTLQPKDDFSDEVVIRLAQQRRDIVMKTTIDLGSLFSDEVAIAEIRSSESALFYIFGPSQDRLEFRTGPSSFSLSSPAAAAPVDADAPESKAKSGGISVSGFIDLTPGQTKTIVLNFAFLADNQLRPGSSQLEPEINDQMEKRHPPHSTDRFSGDPEVKLHTSSAKSTTKPVKEEKISPPKDNVNSKSKNTASEKMAATSEDDDLVSAREWAKREIKKELQKERGEPEEEPVATAEPRNAEGKTIEELQSDLEAVEKKIAIQESRVKRFHGDVKKLLDDIKSFGDDIGDDDSMVDDLARAKDSLEKAELQLNEYKNTAGIIKEDLDQLKAKKILQAQKASQKASSKRSSSTSKIRFSRSEGLGAMDDDLAATFHGAIAGAGGMLVAILALQWLCGKKRIHQAYVPVRYVLAPEVPVKQL